MVIGSGPSLTIRSSICPGSGSRTRSTFRVSMGGAVRSPNPASVTTIRASTPPRRTAGRSASRISNGVKREPRPRSALVWWVVDVCTIALLLTVVDVGWCSLADVENTHPAQFGKLGDVGVEHVQSWLVISVAELEDAALSLNLGDGVDRAEGRIEGGTRVVVVEEVGVEMEG